ncbi:hypothetical protein JOC36_001492 [Weissella uvarum]|uniref:hypothetical protein n=1 Tax=Weissella uvarum TaxID=1479233 RepID=UPI001961A45B|nr:hypothetical protein [Weissella uvarum]MBM7617899.1 hypothetical protein [Weissella uvarum]MCM0596103.1 hypothetical protein [Weissella uvarum]
MLNPYKEYTLSIGVDGESLKPFWASNDGFATELKAKEMLMDYGADGSAINEVEGLAQKLVVLSDYDTGSWIVRKSIEFTSAKGQDVTLDIVYGDTNSLDVNHQFGL